MKTLLKTSILFGVVVLMLGACGNEDPAPVAGEGDPTPAVTPAATPTEESPEAPDEECTAETADRYQGKAIISVTEPCEGDSVSSPVVVAGVANVFEATVSFRILDANGDPLIEAFTTAECGTGCWGDYKTKLRFGVDHEQPGTIEVFESSAEDGSDIHKIEIPVTLIP